MRNNKTYILFGILVASLIVGAYYWHRHQNRQQTVDALAHKCALINESMEKYSEYLDDENWITRQTVKEGLTPASADSIIVAWRTDVIDIDSEWDSYCNFRPESHSQFRDASTRIKDYPEWDCNFESFEEIAGFIQSSVDREYVLICNLVDCDEPSPVADYQFLPGKIRIQAVLIHVNSDSVIATYDVSAHNSVSVSFNYDKPLTVSSFPESSPKTDIVSVKYRSTNSRPESSGPALPRRSNNVKTPESLLHSQQAIARRVATDSALRENLEWRGGVTLRL